MEHLKHLWRRPLNRALSITLLAVVVLGLGAFPFLHQLTTANASSGGCQLKSANGNIQHVIYVQFDNTHFTRDNPNVPSDLEQMPNLLNFIKNNGTLLDNHHTPLIAHTASDILTSLTGVYGDQHGVPISNSFRYFNPNGTSNPGVSFAYWTDPIYDYSTSTPTDTTPNMLAANGQNAPAPWVPYTRAGCNYGAVATANTVLENSTYDIPLVFGANSPQAQELQSNPGQAYADFVGVAVHCAQNNDVCSSANTGEADKLPAEPNGYTGYNALFGHKYVAPVISPNGPLSDLNGNVIQDSQGHIGFPGFDGMNPAVSLSYVAAMQEHGVPITYAYISDAHDNHNGGGAYGPGSAGYVAALHTEDQAFGKFFSRLSADGINQNNTLFVFTSDEGDHFVGSAPSPTNCNGVITACTYNQVGEVDGNLAGLLATEQGITTPFKVHSDSAPNIYVTGNPARTDPTARNLERGIGSLTAQNVITGNTDKLTNYLADPVEMQLLHMVTADPARTPTLTMFANPNYYLYAGAPNCNSPCTSLDSGFAWNHGDVSPDINTTWLGMVGPGIRKMGVYGGVWSDHTDIRPTMLMLLGLKDDYAHEGRALFEIVDAWALPASLRTYDDTLGALAIAFKQINAPVNKLGLDTLKISTHALESNAANDATYTNLENTLASFTAQRNTIAGQMLTMLEQATFNHKDINVQQAKQLIAQADALLAQAHALALNSK